MFAKQLKCIYCGEEYDIPRNGEDPRLNNKLMCPKCANIHKWTYGSLDVVYDYDEIRDKVDLDKIFDFDTPVDTMWGFKDLLPIWSQPVCLGEGDTPFYTCQRVCEELDVSNLYLKYEGANPTGSFKDRESSVCVSRALEIGAKGVTCISSGNAAGSLAAYASRAGVKCLVFTPSSASPEKMTQIGIFDAELIAVDGIFEDVWELINRNAANTGDDQISKLANLTYQYYYDCNAALNPYRVEGDKTEAYEIYRNLQNIPDWVVVPTGNGSNLAGIWKGFKEMFNLGIINRLPKLICVQVKGGDPIAKAFEQKKDSSVRVENPPDSIAEGIVARDCYDATKALRALRESGGVTVAVDDLEVIEYMELLAGKEGVFVEPTSATTLAAVGKLRETYAIEKSDKIVCVLTGSGLKATKEVMVKCKKEVRPVDKVKKSDYITLIKDIAKVAKKQFPTITIPLASDLLGPPEAAAKPTNGNAGKGGSANSSSNHSKQKENNSNKTNS
ncbi:MAG: threonine synthase [Candidatus Atabeyarchaeum deiterrae]